MGDVEKVFKKVEDASLKPFKAVRDAIIPQPEKQKTVEQPSATGSDPEVQAAMEKERRIARVRRGRSSTILTQTTNNKTLLGQ